MRARFASVILGCGLVLAASPLLAKPATSHVFAPIELSVRAIPLFPDDADETTAGQLVYRGGLELSSPSPNFGGLSGMVLDDGRITAVTDAGYFLRMRIEIAKDRLVGAGEPEMAPMLGSDGAPFADKALADAEAIAFDGTSKGYLVAFEHKHRLLAYPIGRNGTIGLPAPRAMPDPMPKLGANEGLEGIVADPAAPDRIIAFAESPVGAPDMLNGWIFGKGPTRALALPRTGDYSVTDLAFGPDGALFVLERRYTRATGVGMQIRRIDRADLDADGPLEARILTRLAFPASIDNMEALAVFEGADGDTMFLVLSDDNFSGFQRTLLLLFALETAE